MEMTLADARALRLPIVGGIGAEWAENGRAVRALDIAAQLRQDRHRPVRVTITSNGGSVHEAKRIMHEMMDHRGHVVARVPERCHSAAGMILAGAGHRIGRPGSRYLLHPAAFERDGIFPRRLDANRLRRLAVDADDATETVVKALAARCDAPEWWWRMAIGEGRELGAMGALNVGLIAEVEGMPDSAAWATAWRPGVDGTGRWVG